MLGIVYEPQQSYARMTLATLPENAQMPSVSGFAECQTTGTRQKFTLPSARQRALGKDVAHSMPKRYECQPSAKKGTRHSSPLPSASGRALGKDGSRAQHARPPCDGRQGG